MVFFHSDYLHIEYHEPDNVLISQWCGACTSVEYRQALAFSIHYTKEYNVNFAIVDWRLLPPLADEDLEWTFDLFGKHFSELSLKRFATISAFDTEAEQQQQQIMEASTKHLPLEIQSFEDLTSAYDWITFKRA